MLQSEKIGELCKPHKKENIMPTVISEKEYKGYLKDSQEGQLSPEKMQKIELYRTKKVAEINNKINLGIIQVLAAIKTTSWCSRIAICFEILFKRKNKDFNEFGEYIGNPEEEKKLPWCIRLNYSIKLFFSSKNPNE